MRLFWILMVVAGWSATAAVINSDPNTPVNWSIVQPGDTIALAAGNYSGGFTVKKSGTAEKPIVIKGPASGSATWKSGWDVGTSNYVTIDGDHADPYGIRIDLSGGSGGSGMIWGNTANVTDLTVKFVELIGTPKTSGVTSGSYGLNFAPYDFQRKNLLVDHCRLYQWCESVRANKWKDCVIQFTEIRKTQTDNVDHADVIYDYPSDGTVWRYNSIHESPVDGMFFEYGGAKNWQFYGNVYWASQNHLIFFKAPGTYGPVKIYNNVFYCPKQGSDYAYISKSSSSLASGSQVRNNVFFNVTNDFGSASDYNAYSPATTNGYGWPKSETHSFEFSGSVFVDAASGNFRLSPAGVTAFKGKGYTLAAPFDKDADGNSFTPNAWDVGAFVAGGGTGPTPTPAPSATPTPSPTATPTPAAPKFKTGDFVTPLPDSTVNVRSEPAGAQIGAHAAPDKAEVVSGPTSADLNGTPVQWYQLDWTAGTDGYSGDDDLAKTSVPAPTPTPTPAPTPPTPTPTPSPSPSPSPSQTYGEWTKELNEAQADWITKHPPYPDNGAKHEPVD